MPARGMALAPARIPATAVALVMVVALALALALVPTPHHTPASARPACRSPPEQCRRHRIRRSPRHCHCRYLRRHRPLTRAPPPQARCPTPDDATSAHVDRVKTTTDCASPTSPARRRVRQAPARSTARTASQGRQGRASTTLASAARTVMRRYTAVPPAAWSATPTPRRCRRLTGPVHRAVTTRLDHAN